MSEKVGAGEEPSGNAVDRAFARMRRDGRLRLRVGAAPRGDGDRPEYVYSREWADLDDLLLRLGAMAGGGECIETTAVWTILAAIREALDEGDVEALERMHAPARAYLRRACGVLPHERPQDLRGDARNGSGDDFVSARSYVTVARSVLASGWPELLELVRQCRESLVQASLERRPSRQDIVLAAEGDALLFATIMRDGFPGIRSIAGDHRDALASRIQPHLTRAYEGVLLDDRASRCEDVAADILDVELERSGFDLEARRGALDFHRARGTSPPPNRW